MLRFLCTLLFAGFLGLGAGCSQGDQGHDHDQAGHQGMQMQGAGNVGICPVMKLPASEQY